MCTIYSSACLSFSFSLSSSSSIFFLMQCRKGNRIRLRFLLTHEWTYVGQIIPLEEAVALILSLRSSFWDICCIFSVRLCLEARSAIFRVNYNYFQLDVSSAKYKASYCLGTCTCTCRTCTVGAGIYAYDAQNWTLAYWYVTAVIICTCTAQYHTVHFILNNIMHIILYSYFILFINKKTCKCMVDYWLSKNEQERVSHMYMHQLYNLRDNNWSQRTSKDLKQADIVHIV